MRIEHSIGHEGYLGDNLIKIFDHESYLDRVIAAKFGVKFHAHSTKSGDLTALRDIADHYGLKYFSNEHADFNFDDRDFYNFMMLVFKNPRTIMGMI